MVKTYFFYLLSLLTLTSIQLNAQTDTRAKQLLNEVSKKYNSYKTIQSDFSLSVKNTEGKSFDNKGIMYFNKAKQQYRIELNEELIISDGKTVWNISKEIKEVQITQADNSSSSIGPNNLFTFYQSGYKYVSMPDEKVSKNGQSQQLQVIDLSPEDTKTNYFKIRIRLNNNKHIHDVTIFDKSNNRFTYSIQSLYIGKKMPADRFTFQKKDYPNYEIVDLR